MARAEIIIGETVSNHYNGAGTNYVVETLNGVVYQVYVDRLADLKFTKSADGGLTWKDPVNIFTGNVLGVAVWYDRWSGISGDLIHIAWYEDATDDILYNNINTASGDALGGQTTVFAGNTAVSGGALSIVRGRNGDLRVAGSIDAGAEDGAWSSADVGATWGDTIADPSEGATQDQYFLLPGWNADTADVMLIFGDASANGLSVKRYDDSANSWAETAIIADGSWVDFTAPNSFPHVAVAVDLANSRNIIVAWTAVDSLNADLRCFIIDDTTITETATNVVLNSTDDQGLCAIGIEINSGDWYVFYCGKTDGSESFSTSVQVYYKVSTDDGATWGAETLLTSELHSTQWLVCNPRFNGDAVVAFYNAVASAPRIMVSVSSQKPYARYQIGI